VSSVLPTTGDLLKTINYKTAKAFSFFDKKVCGALRLDPSATLQDDRVSVSNLYHISTLNSQLLTLYKKEGQT
jgi:hypothetical protein